MREEQVALVTSVLEECGPIRVGGSWRKCTYKHHHLFLNSYLKTLRKFTVNRCLGWETASSHPSYKWVEQQALSQGVTAGQSSILFLPMGRTLFGI